MAEQAQQTAASDGADPEAVAQIAAGLAGQKPAEKPAPLAAALAAGAAAGEAKAAAQKPGGELTPNEEIRLLRDRMAKMEERESALQAERVAMNSTEEFIRTQFPGVPGELCRRFMPVTADKAVLEREGQKLNEMISELCKAEVHAGRMQWANVGGVARDGGSVATARQYGSPPSMLPPDSKNPAELIAMGLQNRR